MNDEQITAVAREYAEFTDLSPVDKKNVSMICKNFLKYTLRRFCLVEKKDIEAKYQEAKERYFDTNVDTTDIVMYSSRILSLLKSLFPEIAKENNIYVIIESYIDIGGTTTYTYLGYVATKSEANKCVFDLNEKKRTWKNQAEASCTYYYYEEVEPYNENKL